MMIIESYEQFVVKAKECKEQYEEVPRTFFDIKPELNHRKQWKTMVYNIECKRGQEYKRDIIWSFLNNDMPYEEMIFILERKQ